MMVEVSNSSQQKGKNFTTNLLLNVLLQVLIQQPPQLQQSPQLAQMELVSDGANIHIVTEISVSSKFIATVIYNRWSVIQILTNDRAT